MAVKKKPLEWMVEVTMTLGKERSAGAWSVDLQGDVKQTLQGMMQAKTEACNMICTAYDAIMASASKDFSTRLTNTRRKK